MLESRWGRRLGLGITAFAGILAIAAASVGAATAGERPPPDCATAGAIARASGSAWYRLDPTIQDGRRIGQRLQVGQGRDRVWTRALDAESFATGPHDGLVVVGSDDGSRSTISIVDTGRGCESIVATSADVVRSAILAPDGGTLFEHRVDRTDRHDLGIWQRQLGGDARPVLPAPDADPGFGRTWRTELRWSGRRLLVASCDAVACRFREFDPMSGAVRSISDPSLGSLVGASGDALIVRGACLGLPCPVLRADLGSGVVTTLGEEIGGAVVAADAAGRPVVVLEPMDGHELSTLALDGTVIAITEADPATPLALPMPEAGAELPDGWIPLVGTSGPLARRLDTTTSRLLDEVRP